MMLVYGAGMEAEWRLRIVCMAVSDYLPFYESLESAESCGRSCRRESKRSAKKGGFLQELLLKLLQIFPLIFG
jgi:hypothetical protein